MTNAWWWVVLGDIEPTPEAAFGKVSATMRRLVGTITDESADLLLR
ncbi:hypothetical protein [Nonomuraea sp. NPDC049400]